MSISFVVAMQNSGKFLETDQTNWNAFAAYSSRVRRFHVHPSTGIFSDVEPRVDDLVNLDRLCPFPLVFPNLQSLEVLLLPDIRESSFAYISRYFCDSLEKVKLLFTNHAHTSDFELLSVVPQKYDSLLRQLSEKSPNIKELHLRDGGEKARDVPERTLLDVLPTFQSLEMLTLRDDILSLLVVETISRLPKLKTLHVNWAFTGSWLWTQLQTICKRANADGPLFPSLRVLKAYLQITDVAALQSTRGLLSRIQHLRVLNTDARSDPSMTELLSNIVQSFPELRVLHIAQPRGGSIPDMGLSARPFATLQQLPQLTTLSLYSEVESSISDDDLADLVRWVPSLKCLCIGPRRKRVPNYNFTFSALNVLSHQPNNLRILELQLRISLRSNALCIADRNGDPGVHLKGLKECRLLTHLVSWDQISDEEIASVQEFLDKCLSKDCAKQVRRQIDGRASV
jgi:hypothetical protein